MCLKIIRKYSVLTGWTYLWYLPKNIYCKNISRQATSLKKKKHCENVAEKLEKYVQDVLSDDLASCSKVKPK